MSYKVFNKIAVFNKYERVKNNTGHTTDKLISSRKVLCWIENASANEVYTARAVGMRPVNTFVVNNTQYKGEQEIDYKGITYSVIRVYEAIFDGIPVTKIVTEVKTGARK